MMGPRTRRQTDVLYVAAYGFGLRLWLSTLAVIGSAVVIGSAFKPNADGADSLAFALAAVLFFALTAWLMLTLWRDRVVFKREGMFVTTLLSTRWWPYDSIVSVENRGDQIRCTFKDGSRMLINCHMAPIALVESLLEARMANQR